MTSLRNTASSRSAGSIGSSGRDWITCTFSTPSRAIRSRTLSSWRASMSTANTRPSGPTARARGTVHVPLPQPRSATRSPARGAMSARIARRSPASSSSSARAAGRRAVRATSPRPAKSSHRARITTPPCGNGPPVRPAPGPRPSCPPRGPSGRRPRPPCAADRVARPSARRARSAHAHRAKPPRHRVP